MEKDKSHQIYKYIHWLIFACFFVAPQAFSGATVFCETTQLGNWLGATTWTDCNALSADSAEKVSLEEPNYVLLNSTDIVSGAICNDATVVTNDLDSGPGSFREAVNNTCENGTITFADQYNIVLDTAIEFNNPLLRIDGSGQVFQSSGLHSVFRILEDSFVWVNEITIRDNVTNNGAVVNLGVLLMYDSFFSNNINVSVNGGGAITNLGNMSIFRSSFYQNNATQGGAIHNANAAAFVASSTFYQNGNITTNQGGAIYNDSQLELINVTLVDSGNGSMVEGNSIYSTDKNELVRIINTVIANKNPSLSECLSPPIGFFELSNTWIEDRSCNPPLSGEISLGSWGDYGGYSPTLPIPSESPLINAGFDIFCTTSTNDIDQLGNPRFIGVSCDIGAVEFIDTEPPEVTAIQIVDSTIATCGDTDVVVDEIQVTYNEPMLNSETVGNYQIRHAGPDQSFLTGDDLLINVVSAVSNNIRPNPTVTLQTSNPIPDGLARLIIDSNVSDEFFLELYDGAGYQHPYRVDTGNAFNGGHFDDCVDTDPFIPWQITAATVSTGADKDSSNASLSLVTEINDVNTFSMNQCVDANSAIRVTMAAFMKDNPVGSRMQGTDFSLTMNCRQFDDLACSGNELATISGQDMALPSSEDWRNVQFDLGAFDDMTRSVQCGIDISANQAANSQFFIDAVELKVIQDLIFADGFD